MSATPGFYLSPMGVERVERLTVMLGLVAYGLRGKARAAMLAEVNGVRAIIGRAPVPDVMRKRSKGKR